MSDRFELLDFDECVKLGYLDEIERSYSEWNTFVVEFPENGSPVVIGRDGGEPEDQTLYRDFKWVVPALNAAFEAGINVGKALSAGRFTNGKEFSDVMTAYVQEIL